MILFSKEKIRLLDVVLFLVALATVYANGTWMHFDHKVFIKLTLLFLLVFFLFLKGINRGLSSTNFIVIFLLVFPIISTYLINYSQNVNVANILNTSALLILFSLLPRQDLTAILEKYCRIVFFLVCVAIPLGICSIFYLEAFEKAPKVYSSFFDAGGGYWYNLVVFTERSIQDFRVQSVFWEPGAWAYNQMIAFYFLVFVKNEHKKIPFFFISLLLTLSTSGILACLICLVPLIRKFDKRYFLLGFTIALIIVGGILYLISKNEVLSEVLYQNTIGKFSSSSASFEDRYSASANAFRIANDNPLFGIGRLDNDSFVYVTSGISEVAYQLGYLYLIVYFTAFLQVFRKMGTVLAIAFCFILMNSEAYSFYPLNMLLIAMGSKLVLQKRPAPGKIFALASPV
jgi:hypothetical protein